MAYLYIKISNMLLFLYVSNRRHSKFSSGCLVTIYGVRFLQLSASVCGPFALCCNSHKSVTLDKGVSETERRGRGVRENKSEKIIRERDDEKGEEKERDADKRLKHGATFS